MMAELFPFWSGLRLMGRHWEDLPIMLIRSRRNCLAYISDLERAKIRGKVLDLKIHLSTEGILR